MRKTKFITICLMVFSAASALMASTDFNINGSFNLGYVPNSTMDDAVSGYGDAAAEVLNELNDTDVFKGEESGSGFGYGADLEARMLLDSIGFGCSIGYQSAGTSTSKAKAKGYKSEQSLSLELDALSYMGTLYYRYALSESSFILAGAGLGYYKGTMTVKEEASGFISDNFENEYKYRDNAIGGHVKLEYDILIGALNIYGGVMGRYAEMDEFKKDGDTLKYKNDNLDGNFTGVLFYLGGGIMF